MLSIAEAFAAETLAREIFREFPNGVGSVSATIVSVIDDSIIKATMGWNDQAKYYKDWLGIKVDWKNILSLADARNSIAHGLGNLTRRQKRVEQSLTTRFRALDIDIVNGRIVLSDQSLQTAAITCREFIKAIDMAIQAKRSP